MRAVTTTCLVALFFVGCAGAEGEPGLSAAEGGGKASSSSDDTHAGGQGTSTARTHRNTGLVATGGTTSKSKGSGNGGTAALVSSSNSPGTRTAGGSVGVGSNGPSTEEFGTSIGGEGSLGTGGTQATGGVRSTGKTFGAGGSKAIDSASGGTTTSTTRSTGTPTPLKKFVGNITTSYNASLDYGGKTYSKYWDQVTPENAGKWGSVQSSPGGSYNWRTLDAIYDYAQKNNIIFKQHAFVWGAMQPSGTPTAAQVQDWMKQFCSRYPDTKLIDVVNEPPPHTTPSYANNMGGGTNGDWKWIANAFIWAREACPDAILILNDFNDIEWPNDNQRIIDIVKKIKAQNAPIDAVGAQAHDLDHGSVSSSTVKSLLNKLHQDTGLPVYITEMDIDTSDDAKQLSLYKTYMPLFLETEWIHGITIWGWHYGQTWGQAPNSGLIRNGNFRSAMTWLMETLGRPTS